jgi:hypothetical protein
MAKDLETQARDHRRTADLLDHIVTNPPAPIQHPAHLKALDAAALQLINLPAAQIRKQAPVVARASGQEVMPVAIRAQQLRADRKARNKRAQTVKIMTLIANGATLNAAANNVGISAATARRLRDGWRDA